MVSTTALNFTSPPVVEVVLGVQFEPLPDLQPAHVGLLWPRFRERFPRTQTHPPLERAEEQFGGQQSLQFQLQLEVLDQPPVPRLWFMNENGTELIQIQQDRLIVNWRRGDTGGSYPHFESVQRQFVEAFGWFKDFVEREGLGIVRPNLCEVTYIDHVEPGAVWQSPQEMSKVIPAWSPPTDDPELGRLEDARLQARYVIPDERGRPIGRLAVAVAPALRRSDGKPLFVINTTVRGRPLGDGIEGITRFFDRGRSAAVRAFYVLTSPAMHQVWGETP